MKIRGQQVQFSKVVVFLVVAAVTMMALLCLLLPALRESDRTGTLFGHYTGFAGMVFAAYSGNSAVEKAVRGKGEG